MSAVCGCQVVYTWGGEVLLKHISAHVPEINDEFELVDGTKLAAELIKPCGEHDGIKQYQVELKEI